MTKWIIFLGFFKKKQREMITAQMYMFCSSRRLNTLNKCASMKLDVNLPKKKVSVSAVSYFHFLDTLQL